MHWYWGIQEPLDLDCLGRGFPLIFGNYHSVGMPNAAERLRAGAIGGGPSTWSFATPEYLQETATTLNLAYTAMLFWQAGAKDEKYTEYLDFCFRDLYALNLRSRSGPRIEALHAANYKRPARQYSDGDRIDLENDMLGEYIVAYADGTTARLPVIYAQNIADRDRDWCRRLRRTADSVVMPAGPDQDTYIVDGILHAMAHATLPVRIGGDTYYLWSAASPYPDKVIESVRLEEKAEGLVDVLKISHD